MHKWTRVVPSFAAAAALLLGCGGEDGEALPGGDSGESKSAQSDSGLPHSGAPGVDTPMDTAKWEAAPCSLYTSDELAKVGLTNADKQPIDEPVGSGCSWHSTEDRAGVDGVFIKDPAEGLSHLYAKEKAGDFEVFEPIEVEGYPAVAAAARESDLDRGSCGVDVGVRDDMTYQVIVLFRADGPKRDDPCAAAEKVAGLAIQKMTKGD